MQISGLFRKRKKPVQEEDDDDAPAFGFGGHDSDDSGDEKGRMAKQMRQQARRNEFEAERARAKLEAECGAGVLDFQGGGEGDGADDDVGDIDEESAAKRRRVGEAAKPAVEPAKKAPPASRFIADMKKAAVEREKDREMTDIRLIQSEASRTNHLYADVDGEIAPIVTAGYSRKIEEQRERKTAEDEEEAAQKKKAVEKTGFLGFNSYLLNAQLKTNEVADPEEDYQKELQVYLHKKEQQKKTDRRKKYGPSSSCCCLVVTVSHRHTHAHTHHPLHTGIWR